MSADDDCVIEEEKEKFDERHKKLAAIVKGLHSDLRDRARNSTDIDSVWGAHCADTASLKRYARAMHSLAEDVWEKQRSTRVEWCTDVCVEYFNTGLKKVLEKEARRITFHCGNGNQEEKSIEPSRASGVEGDGTGGGGKTLNSRVDVGCSEIVNVGDEKCETESVSTSQQLIESGCEINEGESLDDINTGEDVGSVDKHEIKTSSSSYDDVMIRLLMTSPVRENDDKIRLLDVGSCYNAFSKYQQFETLAIDLCPAVEVKPPTDVEPLEALIEPPGSPVEWLPGGWFHVVVFSLLLEYLPCPRQRLLCCSKAWDLLTPHGLLLIITPDSHHAMRRSDMMRAWRDALQALGFIRWRYEKQEHLHCMAYRKVLQPQHCSSFPIGCSVRKWVESSTHKRLSLDEIDANLLYIPQDEIKDKDLKVT